MQFLIRTGSAMIALIAIVAFVHVSSLAQDTDKADDKPKKKDEKKEEKKDPGDWDDSVDQEADRRPGEGPGGKSTFKDRAKHAEDSEQADRISAALKWLEVHQNPEGKWSATDFAEDSTRAGAAKTGNIDFTATCPEDIGWAANCDIGLTGLSIMCFAGNGHTHRAGKYRQALRQAIIYLRKLQDNDGCFGDKEDDHFIYNHGYATLAMAEMYGLSDDAVLKPLIDKAIDFTLKAQNPGLGWRYGVQPGNNDSSVTSLMVTVLKSAKMAGIQFDQTKSFDDAAEWFKMVTVDVAGKPKCGYDSPGGNNARLRSQQEWDQNPTIDAMYVNAMLTMGKALTTDKTVQSLAAGCVEKKYLPKWELQKVDFYYWYNASSALHQVGGDTWKTWQTEITKTLTEHQRGYTTADTEAERTNAKELDEHGSWDAVGAWGTAGGRVYSTAMATLTLQTKWR